MGSRGTAATRSISESARRRRARAPIDPHLAEAHTPLGYASTHYLWDWKEAALQFQRAITLNPGYSHAHHWYSHFLMATGRVHDSLTESECALALDPVDVVINVHMAWHHWLARAYDDAIEQCDRTAGLDAHDHWVPFFRGMALEQKGVLDDAVREHRRALEVSRGSAVMRAALGHTYALAGDHAAARTVIAQLQSRTSALTSPHMRSPSFTPRSARSTPHSTGSIRRTSTARPGLLICASSRGSIRCAAMLD